MPPQPAPPAAPQPVLFLTIQPDQDAPGHYGFLLTACADTPDFQAGDVVMMSAACYPTPPEAEAAAHALAAYLLLTTPATSLDPAEPLPVAEYDPDFRILLYPEDDQP